MNRLDRNRKLLKIVRILIATVYLRTRNESLKSCIILPVRWSVKQFFAPNSPIFGIRLPKKQEEKEEEHRQLYVAFVFHANATYNLSQLLCFLCMFAMANCSLSISVFSEFLSKECKNEIRFEMIQA